jgi:hypothetical protein
MRTMILKLGDEEIVLEYEKELELHEETINEDLKRQPNLFAWYCVVLERAIADRDEAKLALEILEAELDAKYRMNLVKGKKPTERHIEAQIKLDEAFIEARMDVIEKNKSVGMLKGIKDSFNHRKEAVIALASNMRAQADPSIYVGKKEAEKKLGYR